MALPGRQRADTGSADCFFPVTPNDGTDLSNVTRRIIVGTAGTLHVTRADGVEVTLDLPVGDFPFQVKRVWATGTSAAKLTAVV